MTEARWQAQAACRGLDPDWWFSTQPQATGKARKTCRGCLVRQQCLSVALADPTLLGMWGGTTGRERRRIRLRSAS
jgi:WhiB family redox-sensing transcriptional regulator